jgi:hypothetical protein
VKKAANRVIFMINLKDSEAIKFTMLWGDPLGCFEIRGLHH